MSMRCLGSLARTGVRFPSGPSFSLQVHRHTAIPGAFLLQFYSYDIILAAVLRLHHHSRCSFIDIGRIAADELRQMNFAEQMCLTNVRTNMLNECD